MNTRRLLMLIGIFLLLARPSVAEESQNTTKTAEKGDIDADIAACTKQIQADPKDATAYCRRAVAYGKKREPDKAIADFTEAIRLDPNDYWAYCELADIYEMRGDIDKAIANWTAAIPLVPRQTDSSAAHHAFFARAWLYGKKGNLDKALADYSEAIQCEPWDILPYCCRAEVYEKRGELDKAIADYAKAILLRSDNAYLFIGRARLYLKKGDLEMAIADCTDSVRLKPDFAAAYDCLSAASMAKGEIDKAITYASEAVRFDPKKAAYYHTRSLAYAKKGDTVKAADDDAAAVRLSGKSGNIRSEVAPFEIVKNSEGAFVFADHRCSKYVPSINDGNLSATFSDAQSKEMAKTSLDRGLFLRYIEAKWPLSRLKDHCTMANRFPDTYQNLVGNTCFSEDVHDGQHDGFDKVFVYVCHDEGDDGKCSYYGTLMSDWRRWDYSLNISRGKDHWVIIESLPNDFMDNPAKYQPGQNVQKK